MSAGDQLNEEQAAQDRLIGLGAERIAELRAQVADIEARLAALENATPPLPVPPDPIPVPVPDPPDPPTGDRRFGCNIGYKTDKAWSPDKPDDPRYDSIIAPFNGFRFMDWWETNNDLNRGGGITQAQKDLLDRQIDLCNQHNAAMYLCLLFYDSGDTIRYKAGRIRDRLKPGLTRYIEYCNELWNTGFATAREVVRLSGAPHMGESAYQQTWADYASGALRVAKGADPSCVTVLGTITANKWVTQRVEERMTFAPDAHGLTFYFGASAGQDPDPNMTVDQLFTACEAGLDRWTGMIEDHAAYSKSIGRRIVGYEGGPHWVVPGNLHQSHKTTWQNMNKANRDPRMIPLCERVVKAAEDAGYERLFWFNLATLYDQWGSFGLGESLDTITQAVKYRYATGQP